jgi:hypothetical protein
VSGKPLFRGILIGLVLCILWNAVSLLQVQISCVDCPVIFGFPFRVAEAGGLGAGYQILWLGLAADLLIGLGLGIGAVAVYEARRHRRTRLEDF